MRFLCSQKSVLSCVFFQDIPLISSGKVLLKNAIFLTNVSVVRGRERRAVLGLFAVAGLRLTVPCLTVRSEPQLELCNKRGHSLMCFLAWRRWIAFPDMASEFTGLQESENCTAGLE